MKRSEVSKKRKTLKNRIEGEKNVIDWEKNRVSAIKYFSEKQKKESIFSAFPLCPTAVFSNFSFRFFLKS